MNVGINKTGTIFLMAMLALAGIGISYAGWTDTIHITGSADTGTVDWNVIEYSGTWVYKMPDHGREIVNEQYAIYDSTIPTGEPSGFVNVDPNGWVAAAWAEKGTEDDTVKVTYENIYPSITFSADIIIEYKGTIPGRINSINPVEPLPDTIDDHTTLDIGVYQKDDDGDYNWGDISQNELLGLQLHQGDKIHIIMNILLPQDNTLMNLDGSFEYEVEVVQWSEYPDDGDGECGDENIGHHADVMLCIDRSGSIASAGAVTTVKDAAKAFVTALLSPDDGQVGIASFATNANRDSTFDTDISNLHGIIDGLVFSGSTNLEGGIDISQTELEDEDRTPDNDYPDYMVIITDGNPNVGGDGTAEATAAKNAGTRIFVLGVGIPDSTLLTSIASPGDYYDVADFDDLEDVLLSIVSV